MSIGREAAARKLFQFRWRTPARSIRKYLSSEGLTGGGSGAATVFGSSLRAAPRFAAFANGIGIHADDYDDTQLAVAADRVYGLLTHPTAPVLPAALAIAESRSMAGRDLLLAYSVGVEVGTKIAEAINPRHYEDGLHSTGTAGVFGAAAATAKLYGLNRERNGQSVQVIRDLRKIQSQRLEWSLDSVLWSVG